MGMILIAVLLVVFFIVISNVLNRRKENEKGQWAENELKRREQAGKEKRVISSVLNRRKVNKKKVKITISVIGAIVLVIFFAPLIVPIVIIGVVGYFVYVFSKFILKFLYQNEDKIKRVTVKIALFIGSFIGLIVILLYLDETSEPNEELEQRIKKLEQRNEALEQHRLLKTINNGW
jgi:predicted PurR-regulated permease PerM